MNDVDVEETKTKKNEPKERESKTDLTQKFGYKRKTKEDSKKTKRKTCC